MCLEHVKIKKSLFYETIFVNKCQDKSHLFPFGLITCFINNNAKLSPQYFCEFDFTLCLSEHVKSPFVFEMKYIWLSMEHFLEQQLQLFHCKMPKV